MTNGAELPPHIITQQLAAKTGISQPEATRILAALFNPYDGILVNNLDQSGPLRILGVTVERAPGDK